MAIKVPADADIVDDDRLTTIAVISALAKLVDADDGLKAEVKESLATKKATFAQSAEAIARFSPGTRSTISPVRLWNLVKAKRLTEHQFLKCVGVQRKPLEEYLSGKEIDAISESTATSGTLTVETKEIVFEADELPELVSLLINAHRKKAA